MPASLQSRLIVFLLLALVMATTRLHHFGVLPDASWAVFFVAGFYLRGQWRWAFPVLMVLAVAVDYVVISRSGQDFWRHYCVSPGYWFLLPAHLSMWLGGALLARQPRRGEMQTALLLLPCLVAAVALCHLFAQSGFYWFSAAVPVPTLAGWWKNYLDWLPAYLEVAAIYVGVATLIHASVRVATAALYGRTESAN